MNRAEQRGTNLIHKFGLALIIIGIFLLAFSFLSGTGIKMVIASTFCTGLGIAFALAPGEGCRSHNSDRE